MKKTSAEFVRSAIRCLSIRAQVYALLAAMLLASLGASYWVSSRIERDARDEIERYVASASQTLAYFRGLRPDSGNQLQFQIRPEGVRSVTLRDAEGQIILRTPEGSAETSPNTIDYRVPILEGTRLIGYLDISLAVESLQDIFRSMLLSRAVLSLFIFGAGLLLAAPLTRSVTRSYSQMEELASSVAEGNLSPVLPSAGNAETSRVLRSFQSMLETLRAHRAKEAELAASAREAMIGRMAAGIAHDIRNPLNYVQLAVTELQEGSSKSGGSGEREQKLFAGIFEELKRMERITSDLLSFNRPRVPHLTAVDVEALLDDAIGAASKLLPGRQGDFVIVRPDMPAPKRIAADKALLERALVNLLQNALEATADGTVVRLGYSPAAEKRVILWVEDSGPGLPFENAEEAFKPYVSTKPTGTGLGLTLAARWIRDMNGEITARSRSGGGLRVEITLPEFVEEARLGT